MIRPLALLLSALACIALVGCGTAPSRTATIPAPASVVRVFLEADGHEPSARVQLPRSGVVLSVGTRPVFLESDLVGAEVAEVELGRCLLLQFSGPAARDLYQLSSRASGRRLVVSVDGVFLGARRIESALGEGRLLVFLEVSDAQLGEIAARVKTTTTRLAAEQGRPRA